MGLKVGGKAIVAAGLAVMAHSVEWCLCGGECATLARCRRPCGSAEDRALALGTVHASAGARVLVAVDLTGYVRSLGPDDDRDPHPGDALCLRLLQSLARYVASLPPGVCADFVLVSDHQALMPAAKREEQARRDAARPSGEEPYAGFDARTARLVRGGLRLHPGAAPVALSVGRLMNTRALRACLYAHLQRWVAAAALREGTARDVLALLANCGLWLDLEPAPGAAAACPVRWEGPERGWSRWPSLATGCGEAEVGCVAWLLAFRWTHHAQLWSGDLDAVALGWLHGASFPLSMAVVCAKRYVAVTGQGRRSTLPRCPRREAAHGGLVGQVAGLLLLGTDFVDKGVCGHLVPAEALRAALGEPAPPPLPPGLASPEAMLAGVWARAYTATAWGAAERRARLGPWPDAPGCPDCPLAPLEPGEVCPVAALRRRFPAPAAEQHGKRCRHFPTLREAEATWKALVWNLHYWQSLQGRLTAAAQQQLLPAALGRLWVPTASGEVWDPGQTAAAWGAATSAPSAEATRATSASSAEATRATQAPGAPAAPRVAATPPAPPPTAASGDRVATAASSDEEEEGAPASRWDWQQQAALRAQ